MATYDLEEQEQIAEIQAWWKQYGNLVTGIITAAALGVVAWQGWNWYQRSQLAQASAVYAVVQQAAIEKDAQRLKTAGGELIEKFSGTAYASLAALTAAKALNDGGDAKTAKLQLSWLVEHGKDELRDLARLRLVALLLDEKAYDEALKLLDRPTTPAFDVRFQDSRGDVFAAQGNKAQARAAYQAALQKLDEANKSSREQDSQQGAQANAVYRELLQIKLDAQGEGS